MSYLKANNQEIYFEDRGEKSAPAVIFLHGFLMDCTMFLSQMEALEDEYRVIGIDARGFGKTQWDGKSFTLYDTVNDTIAVMDHLEIEKASIVGMSQGGYAALRMALKAPNRVNSLVLVSTSGHQDSKEGKAGYLEVRDTWQSVGLVPPLKEGLMTGILGPQEKYNEYWDMWSDKWESRTAEQIFHAMNNLIERDDILHLIEEINIPSYVIHGELDNGVPFEQGEYLSNHLPNCKGLLIVDGAAHAAIMTDAKKINPSLKSFLHKTNMVTL
ncbi:alpha/beta hydrolase [Flammeovirga sp. SubArs3]|uniref:alpha/beta fold hydrolase n=1 Tax=Flammeovirga sp. SubArs3 TaxID=2995316 RepID=UPI00248C4C29|nr:alpha/beta hydrolase [Flammeovirga sp. SubArs3]